MMVQEVVHALTTKMKSDHLLTTLLGGQHIYRNRSRATIQNPSVAYTVLWNGTVENYSPITIQFDIWAKSYENVTSIEKRIFELLHSDTPVVHGGIKMWSVCDGSFDFQEEDQSEFHRGVIYKFIPARLNG